MNHLTDQLCNKLIACKFILDGKLKSDFIALYFYTESDQCYMIYWDDEDNTWKISLSKERPNSSDIEGDEEFKYTHEDIGEKYNLKGKKVLRFIESDKGSYAEAIMNFNDESAIILTYDYKTEKEQIKFKKKYE